MSEKTAHKHNTNVPSAQDNPTDAVEQLRQRLGPLHRKQVRAWQRMSPAQRLEVAFQAYQFALDTVRLTERRNHPHLSSEELAWRVVRRMQGDRRVGG